MNNLTKLFIGNNKDIDQTTVDSILSKNGFTHYEWDDDESILINIDDLEDTKKCLNEEDIGYELIIMQ